MSTLTRFINSVKFIDGIIKSKTEGLTHEDSMRQLPFPSTLR